MLFAAKWPDLSRDQIVQRARILVIDDHEFPYRKLFQRDGYSVDKWNKVSDLSALEGGKYDLILLDLIGVGLKESADQGLGVLRHIRSAAPGQLVVAYSNADHPLSSQPFFDLADGVLAKTADYVDFKRVVDELLEKRFSLGFHVERIEKAGAEYSREVPRLGKLARAAILARSTARLRRYLVKRVQDPAAVDRIINLTALAISIANSWKS